VAPVPWKEPKGVLVTRREATLVAKPQRAATSIIVLEREAKVVMVPWPEPTVSVVETLQAVAARQAV